MASVLHFFSEALDLNLIEIFCLFVLFSGHDSLMDVLPTVVVKKHCVVLYWVVCEELMLLKVVPRAFIYLERAPSLNSAYKQEGKRLEEE